MLDIAFIALFCLTMIGAPIAWFRMLRAKTQRSYLSNTALFVLPILAVFVLGHLAGVVDFNAPPENELPAAFAAPELSWPQILILLVAGTLWLVGGNVLMYKHTKRMGRSFWSILNPFQPQFRDFTAKEWVSLAALAVATLLLAALAMNIGPQ